MRVEEPLLRLGDVAEFGVPAGEVGEPIVKVSVRGGLPGIEGGEGRGVEEVEVREFLEELLGGWRYSGGRGGGKVVIVGVGRGVRGGCDRAFGSVSDSRHGREARSRVFAWGVVILEGVE